MRNLRKPTPPINITALAKDEGFDIKVTVPSPEAFALHKMIINGERKEKTEKDKTVINRMYPHLDNDKFDALREFLTKKEKKIVEEYIAVNITPDVEKSEVIRKAKEHLKNE